MKRILVNATQQEELRVAIVDGQKLYNLDIEATGKRQKKGNIYKGVISSIAPSLNAVFVDYGGVRQGFLPTKEIVPKYLSTRIKGPIRAQTIHKLIKEGQELIVQIAREERSNKGASLSAYVSLTGQYLVLLPNKPRTHGISQRILGTARQQMIDLINKLSTNKDEGVILRTACLDAKVEDLQKNLTYLRYLWKQIQKVANERPAPFLIYKETNIVLQVIQNNLGPDVGEIIIDNQEIYEEAKEFISMALPRYKKKLKLYNDKTPLFNRMQIETQIESLYQHKIDLPSGGSIVLDHTEALTSIDINSARSTQKQDLEETALATNLEAANEIARQLRLRDLGGLLVIDFIDMLSRQNKSQVEAHFQELLKKDRARTRLGRISKFGLLEMSRQRLRPSLIDASEILCPRCSGRGLIRTVRSCALIVLRLIEEEAGKANTAQVVGQVPDEVNEFLINEKRAELDEIEMHYGIKVSIISDPQMETPHYKIMRHRENNGYKDDKNYESVIVRSSQRGLYTNNQQDKADKSIEKEIPAIPAVIAMKKPTSLETFKKLWQRLINIFSPKNVSRKPSYATYDKRRNYSSRKPRGSYANRTQYSQKQTSDTRTKHRRYTKPAQTQARSEPRNTAHPRTSRHNADSNSPKNPKYPNRERHGQYRRTKTSYQKKQHPSLQPEPRVDAVDYPPSKAPAENIRLSDKANQVSEPSPATTKPIAYNNVYKLPKNNHASNEKPKLKRVETKIKTDDNSK